MAHTPWLSGDGQFALFFSYGPSLVPNDTNGDRDLFRMNLKTSEIVRVNVANNGSQANGDSWGYITTSPISADGRFVVFSIAANNLVTGDSNGQGDLFVRDLDLGTTNRINVSSTGTQANGESYVPSISADGRFVVFVSEADNLVANDTNGTSDIFMHDLVTGATTLVSVSSSEVQADSSSNSPVISANGRFVAFASSARNLTQQSQSQGIYVRDLVAGTTALVSVTLNGSGDYDYSQSPSISDDGRFVTFSSFSRNLVSGDTNEQPDVFVRDLRRGETTRLSVSANGAQANNGSAQPVISGDGKHVVFGSGADNLVANDFNNYGDLFLVPVVAGPLDTTPPTVVSITANSGEPTMIESAEFTVTFSEVVTGVGIEDFAIDATGLIGAEVTEVSGSGTTYVVTVSTGQGSGTLSIDFVGAANDSQDNSSTESFTDGEVVSIVRTKISVSVIPGEVLEDGVANLVYTFTRTGSTDAELTVHFDVGGVAAFSTDYSQVGAATFSTTAGSVTFAAGSSTAMVTIDPTVDGRIETNESVVLTVVAGSGYVLGETTQATGTITNDDVAGFMITPPTGVMLVGGGWFDGSVHRATDGSADRECRPDGGQ